MPLLPVKRTTTETQGEVVDGLNHSLTTEDSLVIRTQGLDTTTEIRPEVRSRTVEDSFNQQTTTQETVEPKVTTQLERERTTTSTNQAHQVRTLNYPSSSANVSAEDAVMEIEFTLRIRDLLC